MYMWNPLRMEGFRAQMIFFFFFFFVLSGLLIGEIFPTISVFFRCRYVIFFTSLCLYTIKLPQFDEESTKYIERLFNLIVWLSGCLNVYEQL